MPSFDPGYYRIKLSYLSQELEHTSFSKSDFEEYWESLRIRWNDNAGRNVNTRNMQPLLQNYYQFLHNTEQLVTLEEKIASNFEALQKSLHQSAYQHEQFIDSMSRLSDSSKERDMTLRTSENMVQQADEQQKEVDLIKQSAQSHVKPI